MKLQNGFGSVWKTKEKRRRPYRVRAVIGWNDKGNPIYKELGYVENYPKGIERLELYHNSPYMIDNEKITFNDVYKLWSEKKYPLLSKSAIEGYKNAYRYCDDLYNVPFKDIKVPIIQKTVDKADGRLATQKKIKGLIGLLFDYAMANDIVNKKYSDYVILGEQKEKIIRTPFSEEEILLLWESADVLDFADTILILIYTGMRINELLSMEIKNIYLDENYMVGGSKTTAGKNRVIPIHKRIKPLIERRLKNNTSDYLIKNTANHKIDYTNYLGRNWATVMETLNMQHKPHDTRHTFATRMDDAGANKLCIKLIMGHAIPDVTDGIYTHKTIQKLLEAVNLLK